MSDISKTFVNTFDGGLDFDTNDQFKKNNYYRDAFNVMLNGNVLTNMKGSTLGAYATSSGIDVYHVMGAFKVNALVTNSGASGSYEQVFLIFAGLKDNTGPVYQYIIWMYRPSTTTFYIIYGPITATSGYMTALVDGVSSADGGIDTFYFTSPILEPGRIRCYFDIAAPTKTVRELELFRRYPSNNLLVDDIIYVPKATGVPATDIHYVTTDFSVASINTSTHKVYTYLIDLTPDTGSGDDFSFIVHYILATSAQGDGTTRALASVDVTDNAGTSLGGSWPVILNPAAGSPATQYGSSVGNIQVDITTDAYDGGSPYKIVLEVERTAGTGSYFARSDIGITSIFEVAGGDTYNLGSPRSAVIQIP